MMDPTHDDMFEEIEKVGIGASDFDIEEAIYWFANDYHGGQGSNLYSVLSASEFKPGYHSSGPSSETSMDIYNYLTVEFGDQTISVN